MEKYKNLFDQIGFSVSNLDILEEAFTHRSALNEQRGLKKHNERLEFLGDAVLEVVTTEYLYFHYPDASEGDLTNYRSAVVKGDHLATVARELQLGKYIQMSYGERKSGGEDKNYILANAMEAFIGAVYLSMGMDIVRHFIADTVLRELPQIIEEGLHIDAKSYFQELVQAEMSITPHYEVVHEEGLDHEKQFTVAAFIGPNEVGQGKGGSKKEAQTDAALDALSRKDEWLMAESAA